MSLSRIVGWSIALFFVITLGLGGFLLFLLNASIPKTPAEIIIPGLRGNVTLEEDSLGVPTLKGKYLSDILRAQGWVTARDRLFQMDLIRRQTAGELSEILGKKTVKRDTLARTYGLKAVADKAASLMPKETRELMEDFCAGVNTFILQGPMPFETRVLSYRPSPWQPRDVILVILSMFEALTYPENHSEEGFTALYESLPRPLAAFLSPANGFLDTPILPDPSPATLPKLPGADIVDIRSKKNEPVGGISPWLGSGDDGGIGSNAWAIAGKRTKSGAPILAGDPHLNLALPNLWYRLRLEADGIAVTGVSIPGVPGVVIGSNGKVAWSFTNSHVDSVDFALLKKQPGTDRYLAYGETNTLEHRTETIRIKGNAPLNLDVKVTPWGPIIDENESYFKAMQWTAFDPVPLSRLSLLELNQAKDLSSALKALSVWAGPPQNAVLATNDGHIAWALVGSVPHRKGFDGRISVTRDSEHDWKGYLPFSALPRSIDPSEGYLVSANQRTVPVGPDMYLYGNDWSSPSRAFQITERISHQTDWDTTTVQTIQMDITSPTHSWYRDELIEALKKNASSDPWLSTIHEIISSWDGRASIHSNAYPFLREFRHQVFLTILKPLYNAIPAENRPAVTTLRNKDAIIRLLLSQKPLYLLSPEYPSYEKALEAAALTAAKSVAHSPSEMKNVIWGEKNRAHIAHPFSHLLPKFLGFLVNAPDVLLPGDKGVPDAFHINVGPSMRYVTDLGDLAAGKFNQPGGQSGHLLSSHYQDQFDGWVHGSGSSFEPGPSKRISTFKTGPPPGHTRVILPD